MPPPEVGGRRGYSGKARPDPIGRYPTSASPRSTARADFGPESDINLLVEFEPGHVPGLIPFVGMESELGEILGRKVDLLTPMSVSPYFRDRVLRDAVPLHDAA